MIFTAEIISKKEFYENRGKATSLNFDKDILKRYEKGISTNYYEINASKGILFRDNSFDYIFTNLTPTIDFICILSKLFELLQNTRNPNSEAKNESFVEKGHNLCTF